VVKVVGSARSCLRLVREKQQKLGYRKVQKTAEVEIAKNFIF
jgi:hypothetical protein